MKDGIESSLKDGSPQLKAWQWITEGAAREDDYFKGPRDPRTRLGRFLNHFHHPLRPWDKAGLTDQGTGKSSVVWGQLVGQDPLEPEGTGSWSWQETRDRFYLALTVPQRTDRDLWLARTFRGLGHQVHLIQDAASVPHTRNEAHATGDNLEKFTRDRFQVLRASEFLTLLRQIPRILPHPGLLAKPRDPLAPVPIARILDADEYTGANPEATAPLEDGTDIQGQPVKFAPVGLAEYANANFVHRNTIFREGLPQTDKWWSPFPRRDSTTIDDLYTGGVLPKTVYAMDGQLDLGIYIEKLRHGERIAHFLKPTYAGSAAAELGGPALLTLTLQLDDRVYEDYVRLLLPRAVGYSIAHLDYFFRGRLAVYSPPTAPDKLRIRNLSDEPMQGRVTLYWDDDQGTRAPVPGAVYDLDLQPKGSTDSQGKPTDITDALPFGRVTQAQGRYIAVFAGKLGLEDGAVIGRVVDPRLAFTGTACVQRNPNDPTRCLASVRGLYTWHAPTPGEKAEGPAITALTQRAEGDNFIDKLAAWSPDGSQLAFVSDKTGQSTLWVMDADGSNRRQPIATEPPAIVPGPILVDANSRPAWSPDGTLIAFARQTNPPGRYAPNRDLFLYDLANKTVRQLTAGGGSDYDFALPAWAPDGSGLVATVWGGPGCDPQAGFLQLRRIGLNGTLGPWLTACAPFGANQSTQSTWPAPTPDGQTLLFARTYDLCPVSGQPGQYVQQTDLWEVRADGSGPRALTQLGTCAQPTKALEPSVAPDGDTVAFTSQTSTSSQIYTLKRSGPLPLTSLPTSACLTCPPCPTCPGPLGIGSAGEPAWASGLP